jgi:hypothetical protein
MGMNRRIITAETEDGRLAIKEVMQASYEADIGRVPPAWARALYLLGRP